MVRILSGLLRSGLGKVGYVLWKRQFIRFGMLPFLDISRLNRVSACSIETVFDVGANTGQTTRELLAEFRTGRIFSFEPHPVTFTKLRAAFSSERLILHQVALTDHDGETTLYEYGSTGDGSLMNSLIPNAQFPVRLGYKGKPQQVRCTTIDTFCELNDVRKIDVLKMDVEGGELAVLRGGAEMLRQGRVRFVYLEFNDLYETSDATGGALFPIAEYLAEFGFKYITTYTDFILPADGLFVCNNALFALKPHLCGADRQPPETVPTPRNG